MTDAVVMRVDRTKLHPRFEGYKARRARGGGGRGGGSLSLTRTYMGSCMGSQKLKYGVAPAPPPPLAPRVGLTNGGTQAGRRAHRDSDAAGGARVPTAGACRPSASACVLH
jgi:hypothetical protein